MSLEKVRVRVKEEVESENATGVVSEAAARAGLYEGHKVQGELVIGPETLQPSNVISAGNDWFLSDRMKVNFKSELEDLPHVKIEPEEIKMEPYSFADELLLEHTGVNHEAEDACSIDLYAKCSVKLEIPAELQHECKMCGTTLPKTHMASHAEAGTAAISSYDDSVTENFVCDTCRKSFKKKSDLIKHIRSQQKSHSCTTCRQHFLCESRLNRRRTQKYTFYCKSCERIFRADRKLFNYERSKVESCYRCKLCKLTFTKHHMAYKCDVCKKQYTTRFALENHIRMHTGERPYGCKKCEKRFSSLSTLHRHRLVHTKGKPYECKRCYRQFKRVSGLKYHERMSEGQESCEICEKRYCYKRYLKLHKEIEHAEQSDGKAKAEEAGDSEQPTKNVIVKTYSRIKKAAMFSCDLCKKQFTKQSSLTQHMELLHSFVVKKAQE